MQIHNASAGIVIISDMPGAQTGQSLTLQPGATVTVYDQDADKSLQLGALLTSGAITKTGTAEPSSGGLEADQAAILVGSGAVPVTVAGAASAGQALVATSATAAHWAEGPDSVKSENLSAGAAGQIPYQSAANTTGFSAAGTSGQFLISGGTGAPTWKSILALAGTSAGGSATPTATVTGLASSDTILAVSQSAMGSNSLPLLGHGAPGTGTLGLVYSADPGTGVAFTVLVLR